MASSIAGWIDDTLRCRLFRVLVESTLNRCAELRAPDLMRTDEAGSAPPPKLSVAPFHGLAVCAATIPVSILAAEACTPPLARAWSISLTHACTRVLVRARCCFDPFAACPSLEWSNPAYCRAAPPETAERVLPSTTYAQIKTAPPPAHFFQPTHHRRRPAEWLC